LFLVRLRAVLGKLAAPPPSSCRDDVFPSFTMGNFLISSRPPSVGVSFVIVPPYRSSGGVRLEQRVPFFFAFDKAPQ